MRIDEFLLARIAEDEAVALGATQGPWEAQPADGYNPAALGSRTDSADVAVAGSGDEYGPEYVCLDRDGIGSTTMPNAEHIARHDPARVLAECKAKRRVVERLRPAMITMPDGAVLSLMDPSEARAVEFMHRVIVTSLAQPYADHPDFDPAWRL